MYPAFVNCTTIDWFSEWPVDALLEVADKYLSDESLGSEEEVRILSDILLIFVTFSHNHGDLLQFMVQMVAFLLKMLNYMEFHQH